MPDVGLGTVLGVLLSYFLKSQVLREISESEEPQNGFVHPCCSLHRSMLHDYLYDPP